MPKYDNDNDLLDIDPNNMPEVWNDQPKLVRKYGELLAAANLRVETLKAQLELVSAELDKEIRRRPSRFGLTKVVEKAVEKAIVLSDEYQFQLAALNKAKYKAELLKVMMKTLEHRKAALQDTVELRRQDMNAEPHIPKGSGEAVNMLRKKAARSGLQRKYEREEEDDD